MKQFMITKVFAEQFAHHWIDSWNAHNLEEVLVDYADDFEIETPMALKLLPESKGIVKGKNNVKAYWKMGLEKHSTLKFELLDLLVGINSLTIYYMNNVTGKKTVEVMSFNQERKVNKALVNYSE